MVKKINNFWNDEVREALTQYIQTEDIIVKNKIFDKILYKPILYQIETSLLKRKCYTDDMIQSCLIKVYTKVLPKLTVDKIVTSQSFVHRCINNHILDVLKKDNRLNNMVYEVHDYIVEDIDDRHNVIDNRILIIHKLDMMIRQQRVINKPNSIFLLLLKEYLLDEEHYFDCREFNKYVCERMNISPMTYSIIASRLGIRTAVLNEPYIRAMYREDKIIKIQKKIEEKNEPVMNDLEDRVNNRLNKAFKK